MLGRANFFLALLSTSLLGQAVIPTITGVVKDPSNAPVPAVAVTLQQGKRARLAQSGADGLFRFPRVPGGSYELKAQVRGFKPAVATVVVGNQPILPVELVLELADVLEAVTVAAESGMVSTDVAENLNAIQMDRAALDNLPSLGQDYIGTLSRFLDPGSVGTGGVTLVVDGVEATKAGVSASAIQEIKINQNPYTAEFSRPGRGRIEIVTKAGADAFHGTFNFLFRDQHLNARDAFASVRSPERRKSYEGSLVGPVGSGRNTSFVVTANREEDDLQAIIFARNATGALLGVTPAPVRNTEFSAKITHQFTDRNVAFWQYTYQDRFSRNQGAGGFVLPEAGFNLRFREDQAIFNHRGVIMPKLLSQFRILFGRYSAPAISITQAPKVVVVDAFTAGGAQADALRTEAHFAFNWIVSYSPGKHTIKTGINVPDWSRRGSNDYTNRLGTYSFSSLNDYRQARPFSLVRQQGDAKVVFIEKVLGGFIQDEWQARPNLTLSAGLRFDWQNYFHDHNNFSPRLSFSYAPGRIRRTVIRGGGGFFYDRTGPLLINDLLRFDGRHLQRYVITNPSYPESILPSALPSSVVRLDPSVRIPYTMQYSAGVERQLTKAATVSANYILTRGVSLFRSRDANAPLPPQFLSRPDPSLNVLRQVEAGGRLNANALEVTLRGRVTKYFNGLAQYTLGRNLTNTTGVAGFPARSYDWSGEWGRADFDRRRVFNLAGNLTAHRWLALGVVIQTQSQAPFNITTGRDGNRDGLAIDRPLNVSRNTGTGRAIVSADVRWYHDFFLRNASKDKGPAVTVAADAFNTMNRVNYTAFAGAMTSPLFGQPVASQPARRLQLSVRLRF
ncbi:MAG: TonB-dependent receptor [Acidobacteria bacterium]|nr:TonB-dependent receptor [Acidobacteriota bacterium]